MVFNEEYRRMVRYARSRCPCAWGFFSVEVYRLVWTFVGNSWPDLTPCASCSLCWANSVFAVPYSRQLLENYVLDREHAYYTAMEEMRNQEAADEYSRQCQLDAWAHLDELSLSSES